MPFFKNYCKILKIEEIQTLMQACFFLIYLFTSDSHSAMPYIGSNKALFNPQENINMSIFE